MKGRDPQVLLESVADWHRRLGGEQEGKAIYWASSGFPPFRQEEGEGENRRVFTIDELLSSADLIEEGRAMSHCVGSYAQSCARAHRSGP